MTGTRQCPDANRANAPPGIGPLPRRESSQCPDGYLANDPTGIVSMPRLGVETMPRRESGQCFPRIGGMS